MAFLQLICIASKLKKLREELAEEKLDAIKVSKKGKPKRRLRHITVDIKLCFRRFLRNLLGCFCCKKFSYKLRNEGSCENYTAKSIIGFFSGFLLTYILFMFFVFQLSFKITTATVMCAVLGCVLTIGLAFSTRVRCVVLLTLPQFFSQKGRQALLAYAFILAIAGPAKNILNNMGILSESLACGQEQLRQAVRQIIDVIKKPFLALKEAIKKVVKTVKEIIKKIKEILLKIKRIIMAILRVIKAAFQFLAKIINICNKELGTPFERCSRVFENAIADCNAKLGPLFNWLCSLAYIVQSVCYLVKFLDLICMIVDFISDSVIGVVIRKVKTFIRHIKTMFYVRIRFSHSFEFQTKTSKSMTEVAHEIVAEIKDRTQHLRALFNFMTSVATLFFLFIIFRVLYYRYKFLTSEKFDNKYINKDFRELDMRRAKMGKETVLPLNNREIKNYITVGNKRLAKSEKKQLSKSITTLATASLKLAIYMAADVSLFWILNLIKYYGKFQSKPQLPNIPSAHISGNGLLADLLRSIVKAFQPVGIQLEIDTIPCLPTPIPPNYDRYVQIVTTLIICWVLALLEPYGLRLRHTVMCYYHPTRAKQRSIWLYNHILRSRNSFLKFARRQLRRKAMGDKSITKITCKEYLAANFRIFRLCFGEGAQVACVLCGEVFRESDDKKPIKCKTPGCSGVYCEKCFADLQNLCTICLLPIDYGDLSDISEEKDSSDEDFKYIMPESKKPKKRKWWWSKCFEICFPDDDDEGGGVPTKKKRKRRKKKKGGDNTDSSDAGEGSRLLKSDGETDGSEEGKRGDTRRDKSKKGTDTKVEDKKGGVKQDQRKKAKDSDYYSSGSTTDYSYSYQYEEKPYSIQPKPRVTPFRDVEKQELPDYASMGSFREEPPYSGKLVRKQDKDKDFSSSLDEDLPTDSEDAPMISKRKSGKKTPYMAEIAAKNAPYMAEIAAKQPPYTAKVPGTKLMDEYLLKKHDEHLHPDAKDVPMVAQRKIRKILSQTEKEVVDEHVTSKYTEDDVVTMSPKRTNKIPLQIERMGGKIIDERFSSKHGEQDVPKVAQKESTPSYTGKRLTDEDMSNRYGKHPQTDDGDMDEIPQKKPKKASLDSGKTREKEVTEQDFSSKRGEHLQRDSGDASVIPRKRPGEVPDKIANKDSPSKYGELLHKDSKNVSLVAQKRPLGSEKVREKRITDKGLSNKYGKHLHTDSADVSKIPQKRPGKMSLDSVKLPEKRTVHKDFSRRYGDQTVGEGPTVPPKRPGKVAPDTERTYGERTLDRGSSGGYSEQPHRADKDMKYRGKPPSTERMPGKKDVPMEAQQKSEKIPQAEPVIGKGTIDKDLPSRYDDRLQAERKEVISQRRGDKVPPDTGRISGRKTTDRDLPGRYDQRPKADSEVVPVGRKPPPTERMPRKKLTGDVHMVAQQKSEKIPPDGRIIGKIDEDFPSSYDDRPQAERKAVPVISQRRGDKVPPDTGRIAERRTTDKDLPGRFDQRLKANSDDVPVGGRHPFTERMPGKKIAGDVPMVPQKIPPSTERATGKRTIDKDFPSRYDERLQAETKDVPMISQKRADKVHPDAGRRIADRDLPSRYEEHLQIEAEKILADPLKIPGKEATGKDSSSIYDEHIKKVRERFLSQDFSSTDFDLPILERQLLGRDDIYRMPADRDVRNVFKGASGAMEKRLVQDPSRGGKLSEAEKVTSKELDKTKRKISAGTVTSGRNIQETRRKMHVDFIGVPKSKTSFQKKKADVREAGERDEETPLLRPEPYSSSDTDDSEILAHLKSVTSISTDSTDVQSGALPTKATAATDTDIPDTCACLTNLQDVDESTLDPEIKEYLRYVGALYPELGLQEPCSCQYIVTGNTPPNLNSTSSVDSEINQHVHQPPGDSFQSGKSSTERTYAVNLFSHVKYDEISESPRSGSSTNRSSTNASSLPTDEGVSGVTKTVNGTEAATSMSTSADSSSTSISSVNIEDESSDTEDTKPSKQRKGSTIARSTSYDRSSSTYIVSANTDKLRDTTDSKTTKEGKVVTSSPSRGRPSSKNDKISSNAEEKINTAASKSSKTIKVAGEAKASKTKQGKVATNASSTPYSQSSTNIWSLTTGDRLHDIASSASSTAPKESKDASNVPPGSTGETNIVSTNDKLPSTRESKSSKTVKEIKAPTNASQASIDSYTFENNQRKKVKEYYKAVKDIPSKRVVEKKKSSKLVKFFQKFLPKRKRNPDALPLYSKHKDTIELKTYSQEDWDVLSTSTRHSAKDGSSPEARVSSEEEEKLSRIRGGETGHIRNWYRLNQEPPRRDYFRDYIPLKNFTNYSPSSSATKDLLSRYFVSIEDLTPTRDSDIPMTAVDAVKSPTPFGKGELIRELPEKDNSEEAKPIETTQAREVLNDINESSSSELSLGFCKEILGTTVISRTPSQQSKHLENKEREERSYSRNSTISVKDPNRASDSKKHEGLECIKESTSDILVTSVDCTCDLLPTKNQETQTRAPPILKHQPPPGIEVVTIKRFSSKYCKQFSDSESGIMDRSLSKDQTLETSENYPVRGSPSGRCRVILTRDKTQQTSDNDICSSGTGSSSAGETKARCTFASSDNVHQRPPDDYGGYRGFERSHTYGKCNCNRCNCPPPPPPPRYDNFLQSFNRCSEKCSKYVRETPSEYSVRSIHNNNVSRKGYRDATSERGCTLPQYTEAKRDPPEHYTESCRRPQDEQRLRQKSTNIILCSCSGDCRCRMKKLRPPVRSPQKYRQIEYDSSSSDVSDDEDMMDYDDDDTYCQDNRFDLPYQNNDEYLELVQELEETLQSRNRNRVRRAMQEFEQRSKFNKPLERPIIDYDHTSESEEPIIQKITQLTSEKVCRCCMGDMCTCRKARSRQPSQVRAKPCKAKQQRPKSCTRNTCPQLTSSPSMKTHWQMDTNSGEWFKVAAASQTRKGRRRSRTPSPRKEYCPYDCNCCASQRYDYV